MVQRKVAAIVDCKSPVCDLVEIVANCMLD
jgi:hypothetical protein